MANKNICISLYYCKQYKMCNWCLFWVEWSLCLNDVTYAAVSLQSSWTVTSSGDSYWWLLRLQPFYDPLSVTTQVSRYQKDKPFWIFAEADMMGWQWHQLNHMQAICTLPQKITTPAPHQSDFYGLDALPDTQLTASKHWRTQERTYRWTN